MFVPNSYGQVFVILLPCIRIIVQVPVKSFQKLLMKTMGVSTHHSACLTMMHIRLIMINDITTTSTQRIPTFLKVAHWPRKFWKFLICMYVRIYISMCVCVFLLVKVRCNLHVFLNKFVCSFFLCIFWCSCIEIWWSGVIPYLAICKGYYEIKVYLNYPNA